MSAAKHSPTDDRSFRASVVRHAGAAVALVVLVAGSFWVIGSFGGDDDTPVVAADPGSTADDGTSEEAGAEDEPSIGGDVPEESSGPDDGTEDGSDPSDVVDTDADELDDTDTDTADADADDPDRDDEADVEDDPEPAPDPIDPATISVQVLDGYQADGGTAASGLADQLTDAGYDIVARNPALRYEVTTVLWSAGSEAEGRQVANLIGAAEAREQPGNLSSAVAVHVVVGADRG